MPVVYLYILHQIYYKLAGDKTKILIFLLFLCQAVATSSAFADRLCVATNGDFNQLLSAEELTFCCHKCGFGCNGGNPIKAWERFKEHGLVTGGDYKSGEVRDNYLY